MKLQSVANDAKILPLGPGPVPLYYRLEQQLRDRIESEEFAPGASLPTEDQICEQYGVSRITVRRALEGLHQQRLIVRRRGVGSFVAEKPVGINSRLTGSLNQFLSAAASLQIHCLSLEEATPPVEVSQIFSLANGTRATLLKTLGSLDDATPVAYLEIWFPIDIGSRLSKDEIDGHMPVVRLAERKMNLQLTRAEQLIEPGEAGSAAARYLRVDGNAPILRVKRIYYVHPDRPIEVAYARYHPDRYRFAIEFKG